MKRKRKYRKIKKKMMVKVLKKRKFDGWQKQRRGKKDRDKK